MKNKLPKKLLFTALLAFSLAAFLTVDFVKAESDEIPTTAPTEEVVPSLSTEATPTNPQYIGPPETIIPTPTQTPEAENSTALAEKNINAVVTINTQYPWNKNIPIKLSITPKVSGQELKVKWQERLGLVTTPSEYTINFPQAGVTYTHSFTLAPRTHGRQRAVADIILTTSTSNYVISKDISLALNTNLEVIPKTTEYTTYTIVMYVVIIALMFILLPFVLYRVFIYVKKEVFPKWLEAKVEKPQ